MAPHGEVLDSCVTRCVVSDSAAAQMVLSKAELMEKAQRVFTAIAGLNANGDTSQIQREELVKAQGGPCATPSYHAPGDSSHRDEVSSTFSIAWMQTNRGE